MPDSPPAAPSPAVDGGGGTPSPASGGCRREFGEHVSPPPGPTGCAKPAVDGGDGGTPRRFQSWRGFLFAAIGVNALYLWGMMGLTRDPASAVWAKTLAWLPFNLIATVLYYVFIIKLSGTGGFAVRSLAGAFFVALCLAMITLNWLAFFAA